MTCYIPTGRRHDEGDTMLCSKCRLEIKTGPNRCKLVLFFLVIVEILSIAGYHLHPGAAQNKK